MDVRAAFSDIKMPFITRRELCKRLNGMYQIQTLASMDSRGTGIPGGQRLGRDQVYPIENVIKWLEQKLNKKQGTKGEVK